MERFLVIEYHNVSKALASVGDSGFYLWRKYKRFLGGVGSDSICCQLQAETQHTSSVKSKHYMGLGKHSQGFFSSSVNSDWNYFTSKFQSRLQKYTRACTQLMYNHLYSVWMTCIMCLSTLLLVLGSLPIQHPSIPSPHQSHLLWGRQTHTYPEYQDENMDPYPVPILQSMWDKCNL